MKALLLTSLIFAAQASIAGSIPAGKYSIDPAHSKVGFEIPHLVIATVDGRFDAFSGDIQINDKIENSKADIKIETTSIDTANKDRDTHLRSPDFFDVAKYPAMTFKAKKVSGSDNKLTIVGDLTIKNVTKEVSLDTKYLGKVKDAYGNDKVAFSASTEINRKDFGLTWGKMVEAGPVVGDVVTLKLQIQAALQKAK